MGQAAEHWAKNHSSLDEAPFACYACNFKCGLKHTLEVHLKTPRHEKKAAGQTDAAITRRNGAAVALTRFHPKSREDSRSKWQASNRQQLLKLQARIRSGELDILSVAAEIGQLASAQELSIKRPRDPSPPPSSKTQVCEPPNKRKRDPSPPPAMEAPAVACEPPSKDLSPPPKPIVIEDSPAEITLIIGDLPPSPQAPFPKPHTFSEPQPVSIPEPVPEPVTEPQPISIPEPVSEPQSVSNPEPISEPQTITKPHPVPLPLNSPQPPPQIEEFIFDEFSFKQDCLKNAVEESTAAVRENTAILRENMKVMRDLIKAIHESKKPRFSRWDQVTGVDTARQTKEFEFAWAHPEAGRNDFKTNPRF